MNEADLRAIVQEAMDDALAEGKVVRKQWLVHEIVSTRPPIVGRDAEFQRLCVYYTLTDIVGRVIRAAEKEQEEESADEQLVFAGWQRLQARYSIVRGDESCLVPTEQMTVLELRAKAEELRRMSRGLLAHAEEIDRYADEREEKAAR